MSAAAYYIGSKAASAAWQNKAARWVTIGLLGYAGLKLVEVYAAVADTAISVIELPGAFLDNLLRGWNDKAPDAATLQKFRDILKTVKINPVNLQYNETAYITIADTLENSMRGFGTNWNVFTTALQDVNDDDFKAVWIAFGLRISTGVGQEYETLTQWMRGDLSASNYETYRRIYLNTGLL